MHKDDYAQMSGEDEKYAASSDDNEPSQESSSSTSLVRSCRRQPAPRGVKRPADEELSSGSDSGETSDDYMLIPEDRNTVESDEEMPDTSFPSSSTSSASCSSSSSSSSSSYSTCSSEARVIKMEPQ